MTTIMAILVGAAAYSIVSTSMICAVSKKNRRDDASDIVIDTTNKEVRISCDARGIAADNFKVYTQLENKKIYLYVKGAEVLSDSKKIVSVAHKHCLSNIDPDDVCRMTWTCNKENQFVVTIPLSIVNKNMSVKEVQ